MLFLSLRRTFVVNKTFNKKIDNLSGKIRTRKSVTEMGKLQGFLEENVSKGTLKEKLVNNANFDQDFSHFLKKFKKENQEYANILDFTRFHEENNRLKDDEKLRQDEIDMLREFQKRADERKSRENQDEEELGYHFEPGQFLANRNNAFHPLNYAENHHFMYLVMSKGVTTQVTTLNRVNHFRYLVFAGNTDGIIGYGKGQGLDFEVAFVSALKDLKKNLVALDIHQSNTFPLEIRTRFTKLDMKIEPLSSYNSWGNPVFGTMIQLCGVQNVRFNMYNRTPNAYNFVYAFMKTMCRNKSIPTLSEVNGIKPFQMGLTRGRNMYTTKFRHFVKMK